MEFTNVCIVGGGSAGWMTAATFLRHFRGSKKVTLIESPQIGTIGVGESTTQYFNTFVKFLGLKDEEWMPDCDATYKNSIQFEGWGESPWQYPFGEYASQIPIADFYAWKNQREIGTINNRKEAAGNDLFQRIYSNAAGVSQAGKLYTPDIDEYCGYHIDATKFANWLRDKYCLPLGATHIRKHIELVQTEGDYITNLILEDGDEMDADLYIDCSGFRSLLFNRLDVDWDSYSDMLLNDSTWCTRMEYTDKARELTSYTKVSALSSGWVWTVPTWSRIGTGYNYSSRYQSKAFALKEFKNFLGCHDKPDEDFRHLHWPTGLRDKVWVGNCIAIGLSAGFVEPLESGGLFAVHDFLFNFIQMVNHNDNMLNGFQRDWFNRACKNRFGEFRDFVVNHFSACRRHDTPYWKAAADVHAPALNRIHPDDVVGSLNNMPEPHQYLLAGLGYNILSDRELRSMHRRLDVDFNGQFLETFDGIVSKRLEELNEITDNMPRPLDYYRDTLYNTTDRN